MEIIVTAIVCSTIVLLVIVGCLYSARENERNRTNELEKDRLHNQTRQALSMDDVRKLEIQAEIDRQKESD